MGSANKNSISVPETVNVKLSASGERDRVKKLAREKLEESGWTDEVRQLCREYASTQDADTLTHADLLQQIRQTARAKVPDHVKAELLGTIKDILEG